MQQIIFIADLIACSTCFGHHYAHHQELESIIQVVAACRIWYFGFQVVGMVWSWGLCVRFAGCCSSTSSPQTGHITLLILFPHINDNARWKPPHNAAWHPRRLKVSACDDVCISHHICVRLVFPRMQHRILKSTAALTEKCNRCVTQLSANISFSRTPDITEAFVWVCSIPFWFYWLWRSTLNIYTAHFVSLLWKGSGNPDTLTANCTSFAG